MQTDLLGDKGYISSAYERSLRADKKIELITHKRRNMNNRNTHVQQKKLKKRNVVERQFSNMKYNKHIMVRNDRSTSMFVAFVKLSLSSMIFRTKVFGNMTNARIQHMISGE